MPTKRREQEIPRNDFLYGFSIGLMAVGTIGTAALLINGQNPKASAYDPNFLRSFAISSGMNLILGTLGSVRLPFKKVNGSESDAALLIGNFYPDRYPRLSSKAKIALGIVAGAIVGIGNAIIL